MLIRMICDKCGTLSLTGIWYWMTLESQPGERERERPLAVS